MAEHNKNTILLVDDEEFIRIVTKSMINNLGYDVFTAETGQEAITLYAQHHEEIILVILDWKLPDLKAEQIIDAICKINTQAKILISSGNFPDITELLKQESFDFLQKPYTLSEFKAKMEILHKSSKEPTRTS